MLIRINDFKGEIPRRLARLLPDNYAQSAVNSRLEDGAIGPMRSNQLVNTFLLSAKSIYLHNGTWMGWNGYVRAAPGPVATDRLYVAGDGVPKMYADAVWYNLALPAPINPPTLQALTAPDPDTKETIVYAYTFVTAYGEESAPSESASVEWSSGVIRLSALEVPPVGRNITKLRLYRSETSALGVTDLYFIAEITPDNSWDHDIALWPTMEAIATADFTTPSDALQGLTTLPNGMMVGFDGKALYFCEPYQPHAWPAKYDLFTDYNIVAIVAFGSSFAVLTEGTPYIGQGTHPDNVSLQKIEQNLPCLDPHGVVDLGYAAAYPSTEGLVTITATGAQVVTKPLFTREQWQGLLVGNSMVAGRYEGRYVFSFAGAHKTSSAKTGIIDLSGTQPYFMVHNTQADSYFTDVESGKLYLLKTGTLQVHEWDALDQTTFQQMTWRSKVFDLPSPHTFSCAKVEGSLTNDPETFACDIIADGAVIHTITEINSAVRVPTGWWERIEFEIRGDVAVSAISLATSMDELAQGAA